MRKPIWRFKFETTSNPFENYTLTSFQLIHFDEGKTMPYLVATNVNYRKYL